MASSGIYKRKCLKYSPNKCVSIKLSSSKNTANNKNFKFQFEILNH